MRWTLPELLPVEGRDDRQEKGGRRANGEGSVFHSKATDRWYAVISVGAGKRRKLTARTGAEVVERLREVQRQNADGMVVTLPPTLAELAEEWLTRRAAVRKAPSTFSRLEYLVRRKIVPQFGAIRSTS
jgi:hypothetical protein